MPVTVYLEKRASKRTEENAKVKRVGFYTRLDEFIKEESAANGWAYATLAGFNTPITRTCYRGGERVEEVFPKYEMIGTHAGRRTFICFALSSGIPPQVVMKWTGHSDYKAMKPYIDIAEKVKAEQMAIFEKGLDM